MILLPRMIASYRNTRRMPLKVGHPTAGLNFSVGPATPTSLSERCARSMQQLDQEANVDFVTLALHDPSFFSIFPSSLAGGTAIPHPGPDASEQ